MQQYSLRLVHILLWKIATYIWYLYSWKLIPHNQNYQSTVKTFLLFKCLTRVFVFWSAWVVGGRTLLLTTLWLCLKAWPPLHTIVYWTTRGLEKNTHTHALKNTPHIFMTIKLLFFSLFLGQSLVACDPVDVRNARSAVIEALPHMLSSMALLWGVVMREEFQRRAPDSAQSSRNSSTSVYFKSTKVCDTYIQIFWFVLWQQKYVCWSGNILS